MNRLIRIANLISIFVLFLSIVSIKSEDPPTTQKSGDSLTNSLSETITEAIENLGKEVDDKAKANSSEKIRPTPPPQPESETVVDNVSLPPTPQPSSESPEGEVTVGEDLQETKTEGVKLEDTTPPPTTSARPSTNATSLQTNATKSETTPVPESPTTFSVNASTISAAKENATSNSTQPPTSPSPVPTTETPPTTTRKSLEEDRKNFLKGMLNREAMDTGTRLRPGVQCEYGDWSEWSRCSATCDEGVKTRTGLLLTLDASLPPGVCNASRIEASPCKADKLCPESMKPCVYSSWGKWEECSEGCGEGNKTRRIRALGGEENCIPDPNVTLTQTQPCFIKPCIPSCKYGEWTDFSPCSASCGQGVWTRTHSLVRLGDEDVSKCKKNETQEALCMLQPCHESENHTHGPNEKEYCDYTPWSEWSSCPMTCGVVNNYRMRWREPVGGKELKRCFDRAQLEPCMLPPCDSNSTLCVDLPDGTYKNPLALCSSRILMCSDEEGVFLNCPLGLAFNPDRTECDKETNIADCKYLAMMQGGGSIHGSQFHLMRVGSVMAMVTTVLLMVACMTRVILWDVDCC